MKRDQQRSRAYKWERSLFAFAPWRSRGGMPIEECDAYVRRVWRAERGRYGLAKVPAPEVFRGRSNGAAAISGRWIRLGVWARQPRVILHELAHCLDRGCDGNYHGPRFVGILIGLWARHMGRDRDELIGAAFDCGVKFDMRSIGATPDYGWHRRAEDALVRMGGRATNLIELAGEMKVGYRVAWGACLTLIRVGRIRRRGKQIILVDQSKEGTNNA